MRGSICVDGTFPLKDLAVESAGSRVTFSSKALFKVSSVSPNKSPSIFLSSWLVVKTFRPASLNQIIVFSPAPWAWPLGCLLYLNSGELPTPFLSENKTLVFLGRSVTVYTDLQPNHIFLALYPSDIWCFQVQNLSGAPWVATPLLALMFSLPPVC